MDKIGKVIIDSFGLYLRYVWEDATFFHRTFSITKGLLYQPFCNIV